MTELLWVLLGMAAGGAWGALIAWQITARRMTSDFLRALRAYDEGDNLIGDATFGRIAELHRPSPLPVESAGNQPRSNPLPCPPPKPNRTVRG